MTPGELAALHARAFTMPRPWNAQEFRELLASPRVFLCLEGAQGFLLGRVVADEAELLTVAVEPALQGRGLGRRLVQAFVEQARLRGAVTAFLEVAADNAPAQRVYVACGFAQSGRRRGYYQGPDGPIDAILMGIDLSPVDIPVPAAPDP